MKNYFADAEVSLCDRFMEQGHVVLPAEDRGALDSIRARAAALAADHLGLAPPSVPGDLLDHIHRHVDGTNLNALRLHVIRGLNKEPDTRHSYFVLARRALEMIVGNELAMQKRLNLSVQLPDDDSSLLPVHADSWAGDSPFEIVLWVPLVDCRRTKSMFLLPPAIDAERQARLAQFSGRSSEDLFESMRDEVIFLDVPFGSILLFSPNIMHGNRINREGTTRWSLNCRFKALLAPYGDKRLGEFFEPLMVRPATRLGMRYRLPEGFDE